MCPFPPRSFHIILTIDTYSSAQTKHLGPGNAFQIVRYLYPQSSVEKNQFISTSLFKKQYSYANREDYRYIFYK